MNEERSCNPEHLINFNLRYAEARVDYMGTCMLMGNLAAFRADLRDEWVLHESNNPSTGRMQYIYSPFLTLTLTITLSPTSRTAHLWRYDKVRFGTETVCRKTV